MPLDRKPDPPNTLYYGDNLDILRRHVEDESINLIYLDPPFNSNADPQDIRSFKQAPKARGKKTDTQRLF
ncbi:MAG TPA: hypothetical protein VGQ99_21450 [Tepidisphaeraceae bacterium]|nr:hypothetical protein [Tepidisphaeraceae bacterium]